MTKWEYAVANDIDRDAVFGDALGLNLFNRMGESGWELVQIIGNIAYFKRPKRVPIEEQLEKMVEKYSEVPS